MEVCPRDKLKERVSSMKDQLFSRWKESKLQVVLPQDKWVFYKRWLTQSLDLITYIIKTTKTLMDMILVMDSRPLMDLAASITKQDLSKCKAEILITPARKIVVSVVTMVLVEEIMRLTHSHLMVCQMPPKITE